MSVELNSGYHLEYTDVLNQDDMLHYEGNFFVVSDEDVGHVLGGVFASSSLEALDIIADEGLLDHRILHHSEISDNDRIGIEFEFLGTHQVSYFLHGLNIEFYKIETDVITILSGMIK